MCSSTDERIGRAFEGCKSEERESVAGERGGMTVMSLLQLTDKVVFYS
jgi:hypothetical protein